MNDRQIISNLKKVAENIQIEAEESMEDYEKKEIYLRYSIKNTSVNEKEGENNFYYKDSREKIEELMKKEPIEIFDFLAQKHLEKKTGYGSNPKKFQTPCYVCNQKTLTTLGWSEESYPDSLERFFCRLCQTSFGWIDIKDDTPKLQQEMNSYYLTFTEKDLEKDEARRKKLTEEFDKLEQRQKKRRQFIEEIKASIGKLENHG